jgi:two-component system, chemotaxis family, protein-glutamate methylesterase/glutaminase
VTDCVRVLIVDDSALFRTQLRRAFEAEPHVEVVGSAADPYEARDLILSRRPDIVVLDLGLPKMDGLTFLKKLEASSVSVRVVVVSSDTPPGSRLSLDAFQAGAIDVLHKPTAGSREQRSEALREIARIVCKHARAPQARSSSATASAPRTSTPGDAGPGAAPLLGPVIALGASTGGVEALEQILPRFPAHSPPIIVVQHMPAGFTTGFATRLGEQCPMRVLEASHGHALSAGEIVVAPGGAQHLELVVGAHGYRLALVEGPPVSGHAPSVDVFFTSLARAAGPRAAACLLTGMGRDGAHGLSLLRQAGARTYAQDAASSAVWGMPGAAHELGAAEALLPLDQVPAALLRAAHRWLRPSVAVRGA